MSERETDPFELSDSYDFAGEFSTRGPSELPVWSTSADSSDQLADLFWKRFCETYWWVPMFPQGFCFIFGTILHLIDGTPKTVMNLFAYAPTVYAQFKMLRYWHGTWLKAVNYLVVTAGFTLIVTELQLLYQRLCFFLGT